MRQSTSSAGNELADKVYYSGAGAPPEGDQKLEIFREADFVVCSLLGGAPTKHFCSRSEFAAMKPEGVLISIGCRGGSRNVEWDSFTFG